MAAEGPDRELRQAPGRGGRHRRRLPRGGPREGRRADQGGRRVRRRLPEPPLDSLYDNLYVVEGEGWYSVDERTPEPFRGEREREAGESDRVRELHEAGAAYAGQSPRSGGGSGEGPDPDAEGDEERPTDEAQAEEEGSDEIDAPSEGDGD